jgi:hypothetical protein
VLRDCWCKYIVLNSQAPSEKKSDDSKGIFYEELDQVFGHFPEYHTKILLEDKNAGVERQIIFKLTIGNESLHQNSKDKGVRVRNFATSQILLFKSMMFLHQNTHKYNCTSQDGKTHIQIDHILIDR